MRNPMRRIWHWRSWSSRARFARLSLRTLTGCIRQQEAGKCWSCMALSTGITVPAVENSLILQKAVRYIQEADILIIGGTSLTVYPAAGLIDYYRGKKLVLINKSVTPMDDRADLVINEPIGAVFERFLKEEK